MKSQHFLTTALSGLIVTGTFLTAPLPARADTASTAAIAAGAAAVVGALLYDSNNHPYYVRDNHRYYVSAAEAQYYRAHHHGVVRSAYVPEREYPVARDPYHGNGGRADDRGHMASHGGDRSRH